MARVKAQIIQVEAVRLQCHKCYTTITYHGRSREHALCTKCGTTNIFDIVPTTTEEDNSK